MKINNEMKRSIHQEREYEGREHRESDPPESCGDPGAWPFDTWLMANHSLILDWNGNLIASNAGISETETLPEHRLPCTPSSTSKILRRYDDLQRAETLTELS